MILTGKSDEAAKEFADRLWDWSIPALLTDRVRQSPDLPAVRYKRLGVYQELTWSEYFDRVAAVAAGFRDLGIGAGDRVAIMADPCIEWQLSDLAAVSLQAISYGVYPTCSAEQVGFQVVSTDSRVFIAEDQEHLDKLLAAGPSGDSIERIVLVDERTRFLYDDPRIIGFSELEEQGRRLLADRTRAELLAEFESVPPEVPGAITFTSGTTGLPKAALHAHRDLIVGMTFPYLFLFPELRASPHRTISYLPLAHLIERSMSVWLPMLTDVVPHIGQKEEGLRQVLAEVQPTFFHGVPRIWEKLASQIAVGVELAGPFQRAAYRLAERISEAWIEDTWDGTRGPTSRLISIAHALARRLVYVPALHKVGLAEAQGAFTGGAPTPPRVQQFWQATGLPLRNLYGITEGTNVAAQPGRFPRPGGPLVPTYPKQVELAEDGEIVVAGPGLLLEYWNDPEGTAEVLIDGRLHTGDIAVWDGPGFRIVDRKKDIMITSGGKNLSPALIETAIKASPYISEAIVVADGRQFPSCLVEVDFDTVAQWARERNLLYSGFTDLTRHPEVVRLVEVEIESANSRLARVEQVKRFRIIPKELDPEEGDTTPTRKVKRLHAYELFSELIEDMYASRGPEARETDPRAESITTGTQTE
jgi:long-chain acyl-CoA synthetase